MFSLDQKKEISEAVEKVLLSFNHPEMPTENPDFTLSIKGKESWSWAEIKPNWTFGEENKPGVNPHNEQVAKEMKSA